MKGMKWMLAVAAVSACSFAGGAMAQVDDAAKATMSESQAAVGQISAMTYKLKMFGTGPLKDIIDLSGDVKMMRAKGATSPTVFINGRMKDPGKPDKKLVMSSDGVNAMWLNHTDNKRVGRPVNDSKAMEELSAAKQFLMTDIVNGAPYENMLRMPKITKAGVDKINGETCDLIVGTTADGSRVFTYAISVADRLPRRIEMATGAGEQKIAYVTEITDVKPAQLTAKDMEVALPPTGWVDDIVTGQPNQPGAGAATPAISMGPTLGSPAPMFKGTDLSGAAFDLASTGGKVVVLQFFGSMFKASVAGCSELQMIADEMKGGKAMFVGLACRELSETGAADFAKNNKLSYTIIAKGDDVATQYNIKGFPSYVVIDTAGKVSKFFQDNPGKEALRAAITEAMGK